MGLDIWLTKVKEVEVYDGNFTHNTTPMWKEAGIYDALYNSAEKTAEEVLPALEKGLKDMQDNPEKYEAMDPENGWGKYEDAMPFLEKLVKAFKEYPDGKIGVWK